VKWDPRQYDRFSDERGRPFYDLVDRVGASEPSRVVDLGCGPGTLTASLRLRWPAAAIEGIDSSPEMIEQASELPDCDFAIGDIATWSPGRTGPDVIISNAALQWVPGHAELLRTWAAALPVDGWLAWQVPANFDAPSHLLMRELAESPRWASQLSGVLRHSDAVLEPSAYAELLLAAGLEADIWETTYLHLLSGSDPVLEWVRGTGLRPVLAALGPVDGAEFERDYAAALRTAYPPVGDVTLFPFRRIFCVGHKK
jgi:trans-aconitate 2-methyltransferase